MNNKTFHVGGSIDKAMKGESELQAFAVLQEAWRITAKNFISFFPAVVGLFLAQAALLLVALQVQLGSANVFFDTIIGGGEIPLSVINAGYMANFWSDVLSAPLYVGVTLMSLNHAVGLPSKPSHLVKGLPFALISIVTVLLTSSLQQIGSTLFPFLGIALLMGLSMTIILICEKRVSPLKAIQYSLVATFRKLLPITAVYIVILTMFIICFAALNIFIPLAIACLIWTIPFYFNVKAIIYRNLFGITLQVTTIKHGKDDGDYSEKKDDPNVFNA
ncbi:hypothetical protein [Photobacterium nomapromontoriensis]|uniref:hypothetical protein n=1 Tax=Photobacterium nomapromontoriensis TaxID=2910237 RepID=UPI003D130A15